jgi:hypothetical protein
MNPETRPRETIKRREMRRTLPRLRVRAFHGVVWENKGGRRRLLSRSDAERLAGFFAEVGLDASPFLRALADAECHCDCAGGQHD